MKKQSEEMKECKFEPQIIGFDYNNTGLPLSLQDCLRTHQIAETPVVERL
jgi:hypothetical protein